MNHKIFNISMKDATIIGATSTKGQKILSINKKQQGKLSYKRSEGCLLTEYFYFKVT